jgi:hypothetical protein
MAVLRQRIQAEWAGVSDDDINRSGGSLDKLVDVIAAKTGAPRADIRKGLRRIFAG